MFRKNVAGQFIYFQGVDATTGGIKSGVTWTVRRCIDGTFAAGGGTVTEDGTTGWYKYAMAQADTNGNNIGFNFTGTGAVPQTINIVTTAADPTDVVRFGLTALPNAAAEAAGGLYTRGAGAGQINQDANGRIDVNAKAWIGGAIPAVNVTGVPKVDIVDWLGAAPDALSSGKVAADLKLWLAVAPDALSSGKVAADVKLWLAAAPNALVAGLVQAGLVLRTGTAQGGGAATITLDAGASAIDFFYKFVTVWIVAGTGAGQVRLATNYVGATKVLTVGTNWITAPDATSVFVLLPTETVQVFGLNPNAALDAWNAQTSAMVVGGSIGKRLADDIDATISSRAAPGAAMALVTDAVDTVAVATSGANEIADALLDRAAAIEGLTPRQLLRIFAAALAGKADGFPTTTVHYRDLADLKNRITATVDADGNRTAVTLDGT